MSMEQLSRSQTIEKVGQLFVRGLVSKDNRLMESLNHDKSQVSLVTSRL